MFYSFGGWRGVSMNNKKQIAIDNLKVNDKSEDSSEAICVKKKKMTREREISILLLSVSLVFTVCFFVPVDTFVANQNDIAISAPRLILPLLGIAIVATILLIIILNMLLLIDVKLWRVAEALLCGFLIAGYWQVMFANGRMVKISGDSNTYSEGNIKNIINLIVFISIVFMPLVILAFAEKLKEKNCKQYVINTITYISAILLIMQSVGLVAGVHKTGILRTEDSLLNNYLSMDDTLNLSRENNIIVFLTDRLDAQWVETELDQYPELKARFEGFTFYSNNVGCFTNTFPSVTNMLTNYEYSGEEWTDYYEKAWKSETLTRRLHDNGYKVNLIIDNLTTYSSFYEIEGQCDNMHSSGQPVDFNYLGEDGIVRTMMRISLGKLYPYIAKNTFLADMTSDFSNEFYQFSLENDAAFSGAVGKASDKAFCEYIQTHPMTTDCKQKTFTFIHLNFAHDNSRFLAALDPSFDGRINNEKNMLGGFRLLEIYFDKMKAAGVYDKSTVIIIGDHGRAPAEIEYAESSKLADIELDGAIRTGILIKPSGAEPLPLVVDHDSELSNSEFAATVLEYAGVDKSGFGPSFIEVKNMDKKDIPERILHVYCIKGYGRVDDILKYKVEGDASDFANWEVIERFGVSVKNK